LRELVVGGKHSFFFRTWEIIKLWYAETWERCADAKSMYNIKEGLKIPAFPCITLADISISFFQVKFSDI
jgi:hypothetical protein